MRFFARPLAIVCLLAGFAIFNAVPVAAQTLVFSKAFSLDTVDPGGISRLTFTIDNSANVIDVGSLAFDDILPSGLAVGGPPNAETTCGGTFAPVEEGTVLAFSGGRIGAGQTCTISVDVQALVAGQLTGTSGDLTSDLQDATPGASATLTVREAPLSVSMSFSPSTIGQGGVSRLTYMLRNGALFPAISVSLSDTLPPGVVVAPAPNAQSSCGDGSPGPLTAPAGGGEVSWSAVIIEANGDNCTIAVDVTSAVPGSYRNSTESVTSSLGASAAAEATLTVDPADAPGFARVFSPDTIRQGEETQIVFTVDNGVNAIEMTEMAFDDSLPLGVSVAGTPGADNSCGGAFSPVAGATMLAFTGGSLAAGATCEIRVTVRAIEAGTLTGPEVALTSSIATATAAEATLTVEAAVAPVFSKAFSPDTIDPGGTSRLTFTIDNSVNAIEVGSLAFNDDFPSGLAVAGTPNASTTCGETFAPASSATSLVFSGGRIGAGQTCTISVDVLASRAGALTSTSSELTSDLPVAAPGATAALTVNEAPLAVSMSFDPPSIDQGRVSRLTYGLDNGAALEATEVTLSDTLPVGVLVADPPDAQTTCVGGTLTAAAGGGEVSYSGGSLAAGAACMITVEVADAAAGSHRNGTESVTSTLGVSTPAEATLTVYPAAPPGFAKAFSPATIDPGGISRLTYTIDNFITANFIDVGSLAFDDAFPDGLVVAPEPNADNGCGGMLTAVAGDTTLSLSGGAVEVGQACMLAVDVQALVAGQLTGTSGDLTSDLPDATAPGASATLTVNEVMLLVSMGFEPTAIRAGGVSRLTYELRSEAAIGATGVGVLLSDTLPPDVVLADPPNAQTICAGGTLTATAGGSDVFYSGGSLAAVAACTIAVDVTSAVAGSHRNSTESVGWSLGEGGTAEATLTVDPADAPGFARVFSPDTVRQGGETEIVFTVDNAANAIAITQLAFDDTLPSGVSVADAPGITNTCGGTFTAGAGDTTLALTGGALAAGASCEIRVTVRAIVAGTLTGPEVALTSSIATATAVAATLNVTPADAPGFAKAFLPDTVDPGGVSTLTFTIDNGANLIDVGSLVFTDNFPDGLIVAGTPNGSTTCGGTFAPAASDNALAFTGGGVDAGQACMISVDVQALRAGALENVSDDLTSDLPVTTPGASAALTVNEVPLSVLMAFDPDTITQGGVSRLSYTLSNGVLIGATAVSLSDTLPADVTVAADPDAQTTCTGGALTAPAGGDTISFTGGALDAGATCTITVDVASALSGSYTNEIESVTSSLGASAPAEATLTVDLTPPTATYAAPTTLTVGEAITAITPASPSADIAAGGYAASGLPAGLTIDADTGIISGAPTTANADMAAVTITLTDTAGNEAEIEIPFPVVDRGAQTLAGFAYSALTATVGDTPPTVTAPTGAVAGSTLSYSTTSAACTVNSGAGALTLDGAGACTITVTASATDNYNAATASFTITITVNSLPDFGMATLVMAQTYQMGAEITALTLPSAMGGDLPVAYTLNPALPSGLNFNAATREITGAPDTATAEATYTLTATDADGDTATLDFTITVNAANAVMVTLDADIAGDDVVNIVERRDGFTIGGTVAATAAVSVTIGGGSARDATVSGAIWSLAIAANDADITGAEVEIVVTATLSGNQDGTVRRALTVDLTAPTATWTAPTTLTVGTAITDIPAAGASADIAGAGGYAATDLPAGLVINANTGAISGAPTTANANPATATITATDTNGNAGAVDLTLPAVDRGSQTLTGFAYSATTAMVGQTAPTVTAPGGAVAGSTLSYSTNDATICTVDAGTGVLTAVGAGACTITVTASATANHDAATADFEIQVGAAGTVMVTLDADIAGDDVVNIVERRDGFAIGGTVAATAAVSVTIGGGSARDATVSGAIWSLAIAANDADITGAEVEIVVTATLSGNQDGTVRRALTVDLTAPTATWTAPTTLTVGTAITDIPAAGASADIAGAGGYAATDLPAGLTINANTGAISGVPTTANANPATATITATDTNGNAGAVDLTLPAVGRGSQTLTGFAYSATTAMVGQTAPTVTAPGGAVAGSTLSYSTNDATICTVDAGTGVLTAVGAGACTITVTASATANHDAATADFEIQVGAAGTVMVTLDADIAGDDVVNIVERRDGFAIGGTVAATAAVSVTIGGGSARDATVSGAIWSLAIAANDADITGAEVEIVVTATLSGNQDGTVRRALTVDLTAPTATWTAPTTLTVGTAITDIPAAGASADIAGAGGYAATDLPAGLTINANTGAISGVPTTANANVALATITLTDTNGNAGTVDLTLPAVGRGSQTLTGFAYSATTATVGQTAPTVTAPTGAVAGSTLSYSTNDATICTVDAGTGVLTAVGAGACTITVTASATANHNAATADFDIQVSEAGTVSVTLDADIAGDDVVNIVERRDGFAIGGTVAATAAVSVTVGGGSARDATVSGAIWSLVIAANDADITGAEVEIVVTATLSGMNNGEARRTLMVDLTAPTATWTAPATLTVGEAITDIPAAGPSGDILSTGGYTQTGLPTGLALNANTGAISGAPTTANANPATATITLTDTNGNAGAVDLTLPAVDRGSQTLTGFEYSATIATVGQAAPTVTAPGGAVAGSTLSYSTNDPAVCTVDSAGALTLVGAGACTITVTAAATDNYNVATASFTITVNAAGASSLTGATFDVAEDTADGANVGNPLTAANFPSGDPVWSITGSTPGSAPFAIDATSGQLSVDGALDFEATASYTLTIQLAQGGQMATADVIISVTDVNQAPQAVATISAQTLVVSGAAVTLDVAANFNDPDGDTLTYTAQSGDTDIATVSAAGSMVTITPVAQGSAMVTVTATDTGDLTVTQSIAVTVNSAEVVSVTLNDPIADDNVVNIVEQRDGFAIVGAADAGATVMVTVGGMGITGSATATADNTWTLAVAGGFSGIAEPEVEVVATASMVTLTNGVVRRRLTVDLTAPTAIWTAPATLTAGEAITDIIPVNPSADIAAGGYAASDLPAGLTIDADTGVINGAPTTAETNPATATITLTDTAGNEGAVVLTFPAVGGATITTTGNGGMEISGDDNSIQVEVANDVPENVSLVIPDLSVVESSSTIEIGVGDLPPAPAGVTFGSATTSVDINVSLTASAQNAMVTVCLPRPADLTESLAVYHYEQGQWEALPGVMAPSDLNDVVCGETNTFSPFQVGGLAAPRVTLVLDQTSIDEDGGVATLTARLNRALSVDTTLTVTVDPIGDTRARDFMLSGNVLTIVSGASTGSVTISAVDNGVGNPNRQVRISATTGDVSVTGPGSVTLTIIDDESPAQERREQGIAHALGGIARTLGWELTETIRERSRGADGVGSRVKVANLPQTSTQGDDATMADLLTSGTEIEMTSAPIDRATAPMVRAWARGDKADFNNTPFDGRTQDGEIVSVRAGMDAAYDSGWVLGGAVGWHDIDVAFDDSVAATSGTIGGEIWSLNPYISLTRDRLHLWGAIGGGAGALHYEDTQGATSSNLRMLNGAVGAEHGFGNIGAFDLIGRGEGMFVEIDLDGSPDAGVGYDDQEVTVYGIRGEFELGLPLRRGGVDIRPYGLVGVRWDGGDMDTGAAAEYGVGIDLRSKDFYVEASARSQFSEADDEALNLSSYSLSFGYDRGNDRRGLMVEFGQSAGSSEYNPYGGGALPSFGLAGTATDAEATIKLNARYGTEFGHGMLIPYVETDWRGSQLSTIGSGLKYEFKAADIGLHYDYAPTNEEDQHRINLRAQFHF